MGFLDSLFGSGGSASEEQARTSAQTNYPDWYNRLQQANLLRAAEAAFEEYQPYGGPRMALAGPEQQAARAGFGGLAGIAAPSFAEAMRQSRLGATQLAGADITPYMSPFQQAVTDVALREARRQGDIQRRGLESQATKVGAFGGSRAALEQMEAERNIQRGLADIQATGSQAAYESALAQLSADRAAAAAAAPQMAALGTGLQGALTSGLKEAELAGERERAERQGALDIAYQDYLTQRAYPLAQASGLQSLLGGATVPGTTLSTTFGQPPSVAGQIGGLGLSTLGLLGSTGAFGPAGWLGIFADGGEVGYQDGSPGGVAYNPYYNPEGYMEYYRSKLEDEDSSEEYVSPWETYYGPNNLEAEDRNYVTGDSPAEEALSYLANIVKLAASPATAIANEVAPGIAEVIDDLTTRPRYYLDSGESGGPSSDPDAGMTPLLAAVMAGDENVTEPEPEPELGQEPDLQEAPAPEESKGLDITYNDILTAGLGMMSAASQPGATAFGSLGAGGLSAIQAKKEEEARRLEEELARRKLDLTERELDILEGRYGQEFQADIAQAGRKQLEDSLEYYNDMIERTQDAIDDYQYNPTEGVNIQALIKNRAEYIRKAEKLAELLGYDISAIPDDSFINGQQTQ